MTIDPITSLASIRSELEACWKLFDGIYGGFDERQWEKSLTKSWTYAEQPWHLAYFDAMIAKHLEAGGRISEADRLFIRSMGEMNAWNAREFARRSAAHTVHDSLAEMRKQRDVMRAQLASMTDDDLDQRAWMPLIFGWSTKRGLLQACIIHSVAEYWKLWIRTGQHAPQPSPAAVHLRLNFMMHFMPASMNRDVAAVTPFTMVWNFVGPGGGPWTLSIANGRCTVSNTEAPAPNLRITMRPENFHKMVANLTPPPILMLTGQMRIRGFAAMNTFGRLFPQPRPDQVLEAPSM
jgi:hypothetical protein